MVRGWRSAFVMLLLAGTTALVACDPEGPGAAGVITLGAGVDPSASTYLALAVYPDRTSTFDPASGIPDDEELLRWRVELTTIAFPYEYSLGSGVGTTPFRDWRVVAWLTFNDNGQSPASGDWYGTTAFQIDACGGGFGDYCSITSGVDVTIDQQVP